MEEKKGKKKVVSKPSRQIESTDGGEYKEQHNNFSLSHLS